MASLFFCVIGEYKYFLWIQNLLVFLLLGDGFSVSEIPTVKKLVSGIPTSGMIKGVGNTDILFLLVEYIKRMICKVRPLAGRKWIAIEGKGGEELRKI